jgi:hypothetical protein
MGRLAQLRPVFDWELTYLSIILIHRNAFDWTASMYRHPWHAANHCNVTFSEFMEKEWSPGRLAGEHPCRSRCDGAAHLMSISLSLLNLRHSAC